MCLDMKIIEKQSIKYVPSFLNFINFKEII